MKKFCYIFFTTCMVLTGCSSKGILRDNKTIKYKGHYKVGSPYKINGKMYVPISDCKNFSQTGEASWYGRQDKFHGKITANGDTYNYAYLTAAHPTLPLPSLVRVTNLRNNKSLIVLVNDRGPFHGSRILDMSEVGADLLGYKHIGTTRVRVDYLHGETQALLKKIGLKPKHGSKSSNNTNRFANYSLNKYVEVLNKKVYRTYSAIPREYAYNH